MARHPFMMNIKYTPKAAKALIFLLTIGISLVLFMGRNHGSLELDFLLNWSPDFYKHISNFSISYLLLAGIGYFWLLLGVNFRYIIAICVVLLVANFVCELWINILNTPDITDAYYGFWGVLPAFIFLYLSWKFGMKTKED